MSLLVNIWFICRNSLFVNKFVRIVNLLVTAFINEGGVCHRISLFF